MFSLLNRIVCKAILTNFHKVLVETRANSHWSIRWCQWMSSTSPTSKYRPNLESTPLAIYSCLHKFAQQLTILHAAFISPYIFPLLRIFSELSLIKLSVSHSVIYCSIQPEFLRSFLFIILMCSNCLFSLRRTRNITIQTRKRLF